MNRGDVRQQLKELFTLPVNTFHIFELRALVHFLSHRNNGAVKDGIGQARAHLIDELHKKYIGGVR